MRVHPNSILILITVFPLFCSSSWALSPRSELLEAFLKELSTEAERKQQEQVEARNRRKEEQKIESWRKREELRAQQQRDEEGTQAPVGLQQQRGDSQQPQIHTYRFM
ncbi:MAG: hypothetical protein NVV73_23045 [Cellvibrionaceae bacterium]|nr:hypothetical protein [Cellvibrionaceae bacterium]